MKTLVRALAGAALMSGLFVPLTTGAQTKLGPAALVAALKGGGYVILMRHATTEAKPDSSQVDLANCTTQRNLNSTGRSMARSIGSAADSLAIPVGQVVSSPFCRAEDTAALAFGRYDSSPGLAERPVKNDAASADAAAALRPLIAAPVPAGTDRVIVTHGFNVKSIVGADVIEGEAWVLKPDGKGAFALVGHLLPQDWQTLKAT